MFFSIIILVFLPILDSSPIRSSFFKPFALFCYAIFIGAMIILGWLGQEVVEYPYLQFSSIVSLLYFLYFAFLSFDSYLNFEKKVY
jgi:ubiquinol-cytochrome c reductase cytochrome b subunit